MQSKCSQNAVKMQSKCSQNAVKIQSKFSLFLEFLNFSYFIGCENRKIEHFWDRQMWAIVIDASYRGLGRKLFIGRPYSYFACNPIKHQVKLMHEWPPDLRSMNIFTTSAPPKRVTFLWLSLILNANWIECGKRFLLPFSAFSYFS